MSTEAPHVPVPSQPVAPPRRSVRRPPPSPLTVITGALGVFLVVLTLLAFQLRAGKDPSLSGGTSAASGSGSKTTGAAARSAPKQIVTRTS